MSEHDLRDDYDDEPWKRPRDVAVLVRSPAAYMSALAMIQLGFSIISCGACAVVWSLIDPDHFDDEWTWLESLITCIVSGILICSTRSLCEQPDDFASFGTIDL